MEDLSSTLSQLQALSPTLSLDGVTTKSDLLNTLVEQHARWRQDDKDFMKYLADLCPKEEMDGLLKDVAEKAEEDRKLSTRLIGCLLAAGIPVIMHTEQMEVPKGQQGTYYGYTVDGVIYLNPSLMDPMTPIHEYAHLWLTAIEVTEPDTWERIKRELKEGDDWLKDGVSPIDENRFAEELMATYIGLEGAGRLKASQGSFIGKVKQVVRHFWEAVCRFFHLPIKEAHSLSNRMVGDLMSAVNPRDFLLGEEEKERYDRLNRDPRPLFIGEKGAERLDSPDFFSNRMGSLETAIQMEQNARDPHLIKMCTGWERGVDLFWRYELPAARWIGNSIGAKEYRRGIALDQLLDAPELFEAYPELRDFKVKEDNKMKLDGQLFFKDKLILLNNSRLSLNSLDHEDYVKDLMGCVIHEVQHAIQEIEGFSPGSNRDKCLSILLKQDYPSLPDVDDDIVQIATILLNNDKSAGTLKRLGPQEVMRQLRAMRESRDVKENTDIALEIIGRHRSETDFGRLVDDANSYYKFRKRLRDQYDRKASASYLNSAGEVEARNASRRMGMPEAERKRTLATDTMDVPHEKQCFLEKGKRMLSESEYRRKR